MKPVILHRNPETAARITEILGIPPGDSWREVQISLGTDQHAVATVSLFLSPSQLMQLSNLAGGGSGYVMVPEELHEALRKRDVPDGTKWYPADEPSGRGHVHEYDPGYVEGDDGYIRPVEQPENLREESRHTFPTTQSEPLDKLRARVALLEQTIENLRHAQNRLINRVAALEDIESDNERDTGAPT